MQENGIDSHRHLGRHDHIGPKGMSPCCTTLWLHVLFAMLVMNKHNCFTPFQEWCHTVIYAIQGTHPFCDMVGVP